MLFVPSFVFSMSASKSIIKSPIPISHSLSSYSKFDGCGVDVDVVVVGVDVMSGFAVALFESATLARWPVSCELDLIRAAMQ